MSFVSRSHLLETMAESKFPDRRRLKTQEVLMKALRFCRKFSFEVIWDMISPHGSW